MRQLLAILVVAGLEAPVDVARDVVASSLVVIAFLNSAFTPQVPLEIQSIAFAKSLSLPSAPNRLASAAVADILITGTLVYYLSKSHSSFIATNNIIDRLITQIVSTNGLTCAVAIIDTGIFAAGPAQAWHVIPQLTLVKLYFLSLLVSLNARIELERQLSGGEPRLNPSQNDRIGVSSLTTPLGFGVNDVRPSFWNRKRATSGSKSKKGFKGGRGNADLVSQIQVQTEVRTHAGDTFVELGDMPTYRPEVDFEKGPMPRVNF